MMLIRVWALEEEKKKCSDGTVKEISKEN